MKFMKAINKFFYALLALATVGMVGCQDAETYEPGAPELEGCYDVYFPDANTLETQGPIGDVDLDPAEKTEFIYTAYRNNTDDDITVPVVISTNTENKFVVSELKFEAGEDVAEFKVTLLESEIGVTYSLALSIEDPLYVKQYESNNTNAISVNVTRVKWNDVGVCAYTEDMLNGWYGLGIPTLSVKMQVRADSINEAAFKAALDGTGSDAGLAGIYRMVNPYSQLAGQISGIDIYNANVVIYAEDVNKVHIPLQEVGVNVSGGAVMIYSMVDYYLDNGKDPLDADYGFIKNGVLQFPVDALLGCPGGSYAGSNTYYVNRNGGWTITLSPALGKYELALPSEENDGDFAFEAVKLPQGSLFYSESQALVAEASLEKGKPTVNTDDADRNFVQQYGYLYRLPNLYAEGYPIYFGALLDGTVTVHSNFAEQATGLKQNGYDVYMWIDAEASTFDPETGLVNLVAEFYTYQGNDVISYGIYNEAISVETPNFPFAPALDLKSDFTYSPLFTDTFKSGFQGSEWEATLEKGRATGAGADAFAEAYGTAYRIPNAYANGYDIYFAGDAEGKLVLPAGYELQATGVSIYGQRAYLQITGGTVASNGVSFSAKICNAEGEAIMPTTCKESLETYVWVDAATGSWYCNVLKNPLTGLTLQNAEGTNLYRVVNFFTDVTGVEDKHFMFTWDTTTNLCEVQGMIDTGIAASMLGVSAPGNIHFADEKTTWNWMGYPDTWESLEAEYGASVQPFFDPQSLTFVFRVSYFLPDADGYLTFNDGNGGKTAFVNELFTLDGAPQQSTWENVAVGTFTHTTDFATETVPAAEPNLTLQRYGNTNKYKVVGVAGGLYDIEFSYDESTGALEVPSQKTGLQYTESDGSKTDIYCGDYWALFDDWGIAAENGYTKEQVYTAYPNTYDAATQTYSFYLGYYDQLGYFYSQVDNGKPQIHTFQITGAAPAATQSSAAEVNLNSLKLNRNAKQHEVAPNKFKSMNGCRVTTLSKERKVEVKKSTSMKNATPVTRSYAKMEL